jgi:DNA-directed RNA polymerase specialized sigma24 family protein
MGTFTPVKVPITLRRDSRKATPYDHDVENPLDGIDQIDQIKDPAERAREVGRRLGAIPTFQARLAAIRRQAVLEMRAKGMSFAEIGAELGLDRQRVQQISAGLPGGGKGGRGRPADAKAE